MSAQKSGSAESLSARVERRGRPIKREHLVARVSTEQKQLFERAAALHNQPLSQFIISTLQWAAEETIRQHDVITLSVRDSQHFAAVVLSSPQPNDQLRSALRRHTQEVIDDDLGRELGSQSGV